MNIILRAQLFFLPLTLLIAFVGAVIYHSESGRIESEIAAVQRSNVRLGIQALQIRLGQVFKDVLLISDRAIDHDQELIAHLPEEWISLGNIKPEYEQIRWLDETGMERVRVTCSPETGRF
ncbi:MAG: hypothetical protein FJ220_02760 [Kiritimatiellaceae bacterium]|nr:hypothetical protein [Kiritimatiellaceae bacterium]